MKIELSLGFAERGEKEMKENALVSIALNR